MHITQKIESKKHHQQRLRYLKLIEQAELEIKEWTKFLKDCKKKLNENKRN